MESARLWAARAVSRTVRGNSRVLDGAQLLFAWRLVLTGVDRAVAGIPVCLTKV